MTMRCERMIENRNGLPRDEIDNFYIHCPEECVVMEHRELVTDPQIRYITVKVEYVSRETLERW